MPFRIDEATIVIRGVESGGTNNDSIILPSNPKKWAEDIAKGDGDGRPIVEIRATGVTGIGLAALVFSPRDDSRTGHPFDEINEESSFALCLSPASLRKLRFLADILLETDRLDSEG